MTNKPIKNVLTNVEEYKIKKETEIKVEKKKTIENTPNEEMVAKPEVRHNAKVANRKRWKMYLYLRLELSFLKITMKRNSLIIFNYLT